jgi:hypothetical protein
VRAGENEEGPKRGRSWPDYVARLKTLTSNGDSFLGTGRVAKAYTTHERAPWCS